MFMPLVANTDVEPAANDAADNKRSNFFDFFIEISSGVDGSGLRTSNRRSGTQNEYRCFGKTNDFLCNTAHQGTANTFVAATGNDDQICLTAHGS
jgi:hypothetical protein